ncbi:MAG: carboxypeptidase-like regulatory domain-containing protein, partial [Acidobacteriota bacterium]
MSALSCRVVALVVVLVAMIASSAAQGIGVVSGRVRDERDHALKHVIVTLRGPAVPGVMRTTTDAGGRYRFPAVPGNHPFDIKAMVDGRVPVQYIGHTVRRNGSLAIDFKLRKPGDHVVLILLDDGVPYHELALRGALTTMPGSSSLLRIKRTSRRIVKALRARLDARPSAVLAHGDPAARRARP